MSMSYAANKLRVPPSFEHLLEGLAREILRDQPKNILEYAAQYFRKKLQERDGKAAGSLQSEEQVTVPVSQSTIQGTTTQTVPSESVVLSETTPAITAEDAPQVQRVTEDTADKQGTEEDMEQGERTAESDEKRKDGTGGSGTESQMERVSSVGEEIEVGNKKGEEKGEGGVEEESTEGREEDTKQSTADIDAELGQSSDNRSDEVCKEGDSMSNVESAAPVSQQDPTEVASGEEKMGVEGGEGDGEGGEGGEGEGEGGVERKEGEEREGEGREGEQGEGEGDEKGEGELEQEAEVTAKDHTD